MSPEQRTPSTGLPARLLRWPAWILAAHLLVLLAVFWQHGVLQDKEAVKYTGAAARLLRGDASGFIGPYSAYAVFLVPFVGSGLPALAVAVQAGLGVAAAFALQQVVLALGGQAGQARLATAAYLLLYPVQTWVLSLYSESFFVAVSVLFLALVVQPRPRPRLQAACGLLVLFARPVGILFVGPSVAWWAARRGERSVRWAWAAAAGIAVLLLGLPLLEPSLLAVVAQGHAIGGIPRYPGGAEGFGGSTLAGAELHVIRREGLAAWCALLAARAGWMLAAMRPYFSAAHNALMLPVLLLYPFALATLVRLRGHRVAHLLLAVVLLNIFVVAMTFAEWNGRFLVPVLPALIALAAASSPWPRPGPRAAG